MLIIIFYPSVLSRISNNNNINRASKSDNKEIFTGIVEKKESNALIVKGTLASQTNSIPVSMEILFDYNTKITFLNQLTIPYLYKDPVSISIIPSIHDINIGQSVYIYGLLNSKKALFSAEKIEIVSPPQIAIKGEIVNKVDNILIVDGIPYPPQSATDDSKKPLIKYTIYVQNDTEISRMIPISNTEPIKPPGKAKLTLSDLKKNMNVIIYTNIYVTGIQSFTAFRIEPVIESTPSSSQINN